MSNTVIKVENLSKQYRLGQISSGMLSQDLSRWWDKFRGKEDPFLKLGEVNNRSQIGESDFVWSLKDVSFEVEQGDVLGIIGKNGAGKSTLLKILSKVTGPTTGKVKVQGKIASLLEVGTGFHPELTGRENIYLNGAILGMTKKEIAGKFDEIVAFSGVERYIDTPVKRYSSGMYVRLAFAVAAHLDPEIMIVDEVLAVGDAEFQKKCLGKMNDASKKDGKTVLFVSHNMAAIQELCSKAMLMHQGAVIDFGKVQNIITSYLNAYSNKEFNNDLSLVQTRSGNGVIRFTSYHFENDQGQRIESLIAGENINFCFNFKVHEPQKIDTLHFSIRVSDDIDQTLFHMSNSVANGIEFKIDEYTKDGIVKCNVTKLPLQPGVYYFHLFCSDLKEVFDELPFAGRIEVESGNFMGTGKLPPMGAFLVYNKWTLGL